MTDNQKTMKAVVFRGPYNIEVEDKPIPQITEPNQVIVKVLYSGLCGSDMHVYRGNVTPGPIGTIVGHEMIAQIYEIGSNIKNFQKGDKVIANFSIQCGECFYCKYGYTGQCIKTNTFGKKGLDGCQAEYVLVPYAENVLSKIPENSTKDQEIDDSVYLLMADIFTTGYYGVKKIIDFFKIEQAEGYPKQEFKDISICQIGAGPVGLCALRILKYFGFEKIVVIDSIESRLNEAKRLGAYKVINFETEPNELKNFIQTDLNGLGFDAVLEVVGAPSALKTAYDAIRSNGFISSLGMGHGSLPFNALELYLKNINLSVGRCHAWALFNESFTIFEKLKFSFNEFIDYKTSILNAKEAFKLFDEHKVNKVVFDFTK
ncbi:uncharacterized protein KGF55_005771 [Candida pseudojiufengensis]|uniref:uncharacterized protein n=1 Tax=Candida pseudojiufengensis TaxID=497109 RepID=UPI0022257918|nr:uncharacterized protein KGF55_005771 [Candida pseudojiufengensis]KAI5958511.1 hypothetical protein KGF55_005771 [Candida pseudojiufengensis]